MEYYLVLYLGNKETERKLNILWSGVMVKYWQNSKFLAITRLYFNIKETHK